MPRREPTKEAGAVETWEITGAFTVWVWIYDLREDRYVKQRVGGRQGGSRRLRISTDDRRYNQEQIIDENRELDPFTNGSLLLISDDVPDDVDPRFHLTNEQLATFFDVKDGDVFTTSVREVTSELILRRLREIGEKVATIDQMRILSELIEERYKVGGTQKTVREMMAAGEQLSGMTLS